MTFAGIVVGGPHAGRWLEHEGDRYTVYERPALKSVSGARISAKLSPVASENLILHIYRFDEVMGHRFWHLDTAGPAAYLGDLLAGYHPSITET